MYGHLNLLPVADVKVRGLEKHEKAKRSKIWSHEPSFDDQSPSTCRVRETSYQVEPSFWLKGAESSLLSSTIASLKAYFTCVLSPSLWKLWSRSERLRITRVQEMGFGHFPH